jgi:hypothetical protein
MSVSLIRTMSTQTKINPMDIENNSGVPTPEELQVEQESLAEVHESDLRSSVIDSLGLEDNDDNAGIIEKALEREKDYRKKLSGAIGAKIKYREQLNQFKQTPPATEKSKTELDADAIRKHTEEAVTQRFDEEFLEESDFSDTLKAEMRKIAKINGTSDRATQKDSYIQHLMEKEAQEKRTQEAANNGSGERKGTKGEGGGVPDRFTAAYMATEEGRKDYDSWSANQ